MKIMRSTNMHSIGMILFEHLYVIIICLAAVFFGSLIRFFFNNIDDR